MLGAFLNQNRHICCLAFLPYYMKNRLDEPEAKHELLPGEIGFAKVKKVFEPREDGNATPELQSILNTTGAGVFVGLLMGGLIKTKDLKEKFMKENQGTKFYNELDARRKLQQRLLFDFLKGGMPFAAKLGLFSLIFGGVTTCYGAYTGQIRIRNYVLGGLTAGMCFRLNMGIRGMISGGFLGSLLGAICGVTSVLILYISGVQMNKIYETQHNWMLARKRKIEECEQQGREEIAASEGDSSTKALLQLLSERSVPINKGDQALENIPVEKSEEIPEKKPEKEPEKK